jgi:hypothetical protein
MSFNIELELQQFPKSVVLKDGTKAALRPLRMDDEKDFHQLFQGIPERERMFIKHRVQDIKIIRDWCRNLDYGRNLPLVGLLGGKITGVATLHQQLSGWKRQIGRVSVSVHRVDADSRARSSPKHWPPRGARGWKGSRRNSSANRNRP